MDAMMENFIENYTELLKDGHPHTANYPLISSPWPTWGIVCFYLLCVYVIFPEFMKKKEPNNLKLPIVLYNSILVLSNAYVFNGILVTGWLKNYSLKCAPVDYTITKDSMKVIESVYLFYLLRFVELNETIMFVLRKKYNQVSRLHVTHHFIVPPYIWYVVKYTPVGCGTFFPMINSFIHIVMYSYYALAALGPKVHKYLWWKKYITQLQIIQFVIAILYYGYLLINRKCNCPMALILQSLAIAVVFLIMFADFYVKSYSKNKTDKRSAVETLEENGYSKQLTNGFKDSTLRYRNKIQISSDHERF